MNKLPVIYLTIDEDHETGLDAISLVDHPAIERNWMAFNKKQKFSLNEEKRIVSGAAMVADYPIYRKDDDGREYYVVFDSDAIQKDSLQVYERRQDERDQLRPHNGR
jgi:hypothetical protein